MNTYNLNTVRYVEGKKVYKEVTVSSPYHGDIKFNNVDCVDITFGGTYVIYIKGGHIRTFNNTCEIEIVG